MTSPNENRRSKRFDLRLSCRVSLRGRIVQEASGVTRNISRSGILVLVDEQEAMEAPPAVGDPVRITMDLPFNQRWSRRCLDCVATVVRVTGLERGACEVGCEIVRMRVREVEACHTPTPAASLQLGNLGLLQ